MSDDRQRPVGTSAMPQHTAEQHGRSVVGDELGAHVLAVALGDATVVRPPATIAWAARRPVSRAWPMPSPVITSVAAAASPVNSTGPWASMARSIRAGIGQARWRPSGVARGPRAAAIVGTVEQPCPEIANVLAAAAAVAQHPEADVGPSVGQRERPGIPGQQVGVEPHDQLVGGRPADAADVLADGVPLAEVAVATDAQRLARRAPHPVGGDDVAGSDVAEPFDADARRSRRRRWPPS